MIAQRRRIVLLLCLAASCCVSTSVARGETSSWLFVSLLEKKTIVTFERDAKTGKLTRRGETRCPAEPAFLSASRDGRTLLVSLRSSGELASYGIDPETGSLSSISVVRGGADPAYLQTDRTGRYLFAAYYQDNKVTVHKLDAKGVLSDAPVQTIETADRAHGVAVDSNNRFVYVPHTSPNRIYQFGFAAKTGRLEPLAPAFITTPREDGPRHITLHPSDRWAYVSNEAGDSIGVFAVNRSSGGLVRIQTVSSIPGDFPGERNATARCEMTPDGRFVYVSNRGHDSLACYRVDAASGRVTLLEIEPTEKTPRSFTIEPSGRYLYAAGQGSGKIAFFRIEDDGRLSRVGTYESGPIPWFTLAVDTPLAEQ